MALKFIEWKIGDNFSFGGLIKHFRQVTTTQGTKKGEYNMFAYFV